MEPLGGGKDFALAGKEVRAKINEIVEWINAREAAKITPSSRVGHLKRDGNIDLSEIDARVTTLEK